MTNPNFDVVDTVSRETATHLEGTDAVLAYADEQVFVLEARDE